MDERKSVYVVVDDEQITRVRSAMEDVTSLADSLRLGCEIAYRREPTQEEGDAHEHRHDQSMGASHGSAECFVPMGSHPPCHQNTQERGVADTLDAAKLAAEDSMLAHARLVVETLRPRLADHEREWSE